MKILTKGVRPIMDFSKAATNQNLTRFILKTGETYESSIQLLNCMFTISPEPRIYQYSIHQNTRK